MSEEKPFNVNEYLGALTLNIKSSISDYDVTITGITDITNFLNDEKDFWEELSKRSTSIIRLMEFLEIYKNEILSFEKNVQNQEKDRIDSDWSDLINKFSGHEIHGWKIIKLFSETPEAQFIYELCSQSQEQSEAAYNYFSNIMMDIRIPENFKGFVKAYEFDHQAKSKIVKSRKVEKQSLTNILSQAKQKILNLSKDFEISKKNLTDWKDSFTNEHNVWQKAIKKEQIDWQDTVKKEVTDYREKEEKKLVKLKNTYEDLLSLSSPVEFWKARATKYEKHGKTWLKCLSIAATVMILILLLILYEVPAPFRYSLFQADPRAIKGLIIVATIISFGAYLIRIFAKLAMSAYHLKRDSEEREQLTMVYLALKKNADIQDEDRKIILQALFSRVNTGLLTGEGSPTMPSYEKIADRIRGK